MSLPFSFLAKTTSAYKQKFILLCKWLMYQWEKGRDNVTWLNASFLLKAMPFTKMEQFWVVVIGKNDVV